MANFTTPSQATINLHIAASNGYPTHIRTALRAGADINGRDDNSNRTALMMAVAANKAQCVRLLLESGADTNLSTNDNLTALYIAVGLDSTEIIELLVQAGADVDTFSNSKTPLMRACFSYSDAAVGTLIRLGANLSLMSPDGKTALDISIERKNEFGIHLIRTAIAEREVATSIAIAIATDQLSSDDVVTRQRKPCIL